MGVALFDRVAGGLVLSEAGAEIRHMAESVEQEMDAIERRVIGRDHSLSGTLKITCTEVMANRYLAPHLVDFAALNPKIVLSTLCTYEHLSLSQREADFAIRITEKPPDMLVGQCIAIVAIAAYGARDRHTCSETFRPDTAEWIGWQDDAYTEMMISGPFKGARIAHRCDNMQTMQTLAGLGLGITVLPCYVGDTDPRLTRVHPAHFQVNGLSLWTLTHPQLRRTARVHAFSDFIVGRIRADRSLFDGSRFATTPP